MTQNIDSSAWKEFRGYIATDPIAILQAHFCLQEMGKSDKISALLLDGPPGVGKTYLGKHLASLLNADLMHFQVFPGCDRGDMIWDSSYAKAGTTSEGLLLQAIKRSENKPVVLLLDEIDKSDVRVDSFLLNFLNEGFLNIPQLGQIKANSNNLLVVITKNDLRDASPPLLRRCRVVYMEWPTVQVETAIIKGAVPAITDDACAHLLELPNRLRINTQVIKPPSTSELMRLAADLLELIKRSAPPIIIGNFYVNSIAQNVKDRKFIEKTTYYLGLALIEALSDSANKITIQKDALLKDEVDYFLAKD